ncbi:MAG: hypothetical protein JWQ49_737 [Edaphobacter sp.]|nr:hypothetical protein [Edaphobacter sp.]
MAPLTPDQKRARRRSIAALLVVGVLLFFLLLTNKPRGKQVRFNAVCRSFVAPLPLTLKLHEGATEVQEATAEGFGGAVTNVGSASFVLDGRPVNGASPPEFKLTRSADVNQTPPHFDVKLSGGLGRTELRVGSNAVISSFGPGDGRPWVKLESVTPGDVQVELVSAASTLVGNRYLVEGAGLPKGMVEGFRAEVKGAIPGAMVSLNSGGKDAAVKVWLRAEAEEQPLLGGGGPNAVQLGGRVELVLRGCVNPDLRVEDKSAAGVIADRSTDLTIGGTSADSGTIDEIDVTGSGDKSDAPRLRVRGRLEAASVRQDGHELLPTLVSEVMDLSYAERGAVLIILGFALFVAFKVVDRALSVLLEYYFPKVV